MPSTPVLKDGDCCMKWEEQKRRPQLRGDSINRMKSRALGGWGDVRPGRRQAARAP